MELYYPPTATLPALRDISTHSLVSMTAALGNLRALYWPPAATSFSLPISSAVHMPDSGYASAVEEEGDDFANTYTYKKVVRRKQDGEERVALLRADVVERAFAVRWLTGFIARSEEWVGAALPPSPSLATPSASPGENSDSELELDGERTNRARLVEEAAALLTLSAMTSADVDGALVRRFRFPVGKYDDEGCSVGMTVNGVEVVDVQLWDEACAWDHESVGLQTWGSACVLAERLCATPGRYFPLLDDFTLRGIPPLGGFRGTVRVLELGAGTGLLSMVAAKLGLLLRQGADDSGMRLEVVATDYHPAVLENLRANVVRNFGDDSAAVVVQVDELDWAEPPPVLLEHDKFDVILAADVIYDSRHAKWIKTCAERLLRRGRGQEVMWMVVPLRPTRVNEVESVSDVFSNDIGEETCTLRILQVEDIARRHGGVGRADEDGYRLFKIGWYFKRYTR